MRNLLHACMRVCGCTHWADLSNEAGGGDGAAREREHLPRLPSSLVNR